MGVELRYMKTLKTIALVSIISIGMTSSVFASWWNPTTWKIFKRENKVVTQPKIEENVVLASTTTPVKAEESNLLLCNGSKYNKCPEGQNFICPTNGEDAFCEKGKSNDVKTPKTKEDAVIVPATSKTVKVVIPQKPKTETVTPAVQVKNDISVINTTNIKSQEPDKDSIYDTNNIIDKDGNAIVITQTPNYKITRIVIATRGGIKGLFYKDKNTFFTDKELDEQAKATQDAMDKQFSRGIYAPTAPSAPVYDANKATQDKQFKLDAVNLEIANLNTKYANDVKNVTCVVSSFCTSQKSNLQTRYIEDYNLLQAKYQQIKYSN